MSEVDAIVLDLDGGSALDELLDSMAAQSRPFRRIVIWDNGSVVPVAQRVVRADLPLTILRSETNLGFTGGINAAMRAVDAPFIAWVNNDVVLDSHWLDVLLARIAEPEVAAVQAINMSADGTIDGAGITVANGTFRQRGHGLRGTVPAEEPFWGVSATAALYRTAALRDAAIGGDMLDPSFFAYYEDVDLSARLLAKGWRLEIVEEPLALHRGSMTASRLASASRLRVANRYRVARKHRGVGRIPALLREDLGRVTRALAARQWSEARSIASAAIRGLSSRA